jgi:hypothetical protein
LAAAEYQQLDYRKLESGGLGSNASNCRASHFHADSQQHYPAGIQRLHVHYHHYWERISLKTVKVEVDGSFGKEYEGTYEFRQVSQGEFEDVLLGFMDVLGNLKTKDLLRANRKMLWVALAKQPEAKPLTLEQVLRGEIPYGLSLKLREAYDKANGVSSQEQIFLSGQSEAESQAQDSQNSLSVTGSSGPSKSTSKRAEEQSPNSQ